MKSITAVILFVFLVASCTEKKLQAKDDFIIANGEMPAMANDKYNNTLHVVFGNGDSIMYTSSTDKGITFSPPVLIAALPYVYTYATRGPQIAVSNKGVVVTACTKDGNIFTFYKEENGDWKRANIVNDADTVCKEGLMALSADGDNVFATWLDLRGNKRNKIYGAKSIDGGKTWNRNILIYTSPDSTVCECCKPSVVVWKNKIAVMFRNWLKGNRDLYLAQSNDGGNSFDTAQKLGTGSWKLNGCPMDGGSITVNNNGDIQTVWRRNFSVYFDIPGSAEKQLGEGRNCTLETVDNKNVYAWTENDKIVITKPDGTKKIAGKGNMPVLKAVDNNHVMCLWQNKKQIHASLIEL